MDIPASDKMKCMIVSKDNDRTIYNPGADDIPLVGLRDFFQRWRDIDPERQRPTLKGFDILRFDNYIPFTMLLVCDPVAERLWCKFNGNGYVNAVGEDHTGMFSNYSDLPHDAGIRLALTSRNKTPYLLLDTPLVWTDRDYKRYSSVCCPLFEGDEVAAVLVYFEFDK